MVTCFAVVSSATINVPNCSAAQFLPLKKASEVRSIAVVALFLPSRLCHLGMCKGFSTRLKQVKEGIM